MNGDLGHRAQALDPSLGVVTSSHSLPWLPPPYQPGDSAGSWLLGAASASCLDPDVSTVCHTSAKSCHPITLLIHFAHLWLPWSGSRVSRAGAGVRPGLLGSNKRSPNASRGDRVGGTWQAPRLWLLAPSPEQWVLPSHLFLFEKKK